MAKKGRILSGMRPTGRLHLGNLFGALDNWVKLQDEYECFYTIVDWHALTTDYEDPGDIAGNVREMVIDWIAAGLDPERSTFFVQSDVKEHAELHLLLSMLVPLSWVERVPTFKEQLRELEGRQIATYGFLGYPVLQAADIMAYKADVVPVGEDQLPHLELTREIVRRFNHLYGPVFPEPEARLNKIRLLPGTDGRKMSKSYGNFITMTAGEEELRSKIPGMFTDPARARRKDPGHPEVCPIFTYQEIFNPGETEEIAEACRTAEIGCVDCKERLIESMIDGLRPLREKRLELESNPEIVEEILRHGAEKARFHAGRTMDEVRRVMRLA